MSTNQFLCGYLKFGVVVITAVVLHIVPNHRLVAEDQPNVAAAPATAPASQAAPSAKAGAKTTSKSVIPRTHEPDTLDELKSAMEGYTDYRTFHCSGEVRDALFNKPIEGAKVTILKLASPQRYRAGDAKVLKRIEAVTDADGKYAFELPTDHAFIPQSATRTRLPSGAFTVRQAGTPYFPLEIEVTHSGYAGIDSSAQVNLQPSPASPRNFLAEGFSEPLAEPDPAARRIGVIELRPGKEVSGVVQAPDGKPLPGVKVVAHSQVPKNERGVMARTSAGQSVRSTAPPVASQDETVTNAKGSFRVTMITPGEGMLAIFPADGKHAPRFEFSYDRRGDLGVLTLPRGEKIKGRVLDSDGNAIEGVFLTIEPWTLSSAKYSDSTVVQMPARAAESNADGNFTIDALAPGEYRIAPSEEFADPTMDAHDWPNRREVPGLFAPQKVTIVAGQTPSPLEIRALKTVAVQGRVILNNNLNNNADLFNAALANVDQQRPEQLLLQLAESRSRQMQQSLMSIQGKLNELLYKQRISIDEEGNFKTMVPKGLREAEIAPLALSARGGFGGGTAAAGPRWRIGNEQEYHTESEIPLGALDTDVREIEIDFSQAGRRGGAAAGGFGGGAPAAAGGFGGGRRGRPSEHCTSCSRGCTAAAARPAAASRKSGRSGRQLTAGLVSLPLAAISRETGSGIFAGKGSAQSESHDRQRLPTSSVANFRRCYARPHFRACKLGHQYVIMCTLFVLCQRRPI